MERMDGRKHDQLRPVMFTPGYVDYPEGSVLIAAGNTRVLCNVTVEDSVPSWMEQNQIPGGWITAEYALLPRSTHTRVSRETDGLSGRTQEIRRLIGRSLRAGFNLAEIGPRTCIVDCDVLQADGGTRTAAITGGYVALAMALRDLVGAGEIPSNAFLPPVAAVSVGLVEGQPLLDLSYQEDSAAGVDLNVVLNREGRFIEVQGTAEGKPFSRGALDRLIDLAEVGIGKLLSLQKEFLE